MVFSCSKTLPSLTDILISGLNLLYIEKINDSKPFMVLKITINAEVQTANAKTAMLEIMFMAFLFFFEKRYRPAINKEVRII